MIEVKNLTFSYSKDKQALHGLDFTVEDGEIFGFLGPNGSGKSTTQKILTGILKGHGGKVSLFGQDISAVHGPEFFQKIGVLFEFPYLYANLSAVDNLEYFASFYPKEQRRDVGELLDELEEGRPICAGTAEYQGPMSLAALRRFPAAERDGERFYRLRDGQVRTMYLDPADGVCRASADSLTGCSRTLSCARLAMKLGPVFIADTLDTGALDRLAAEGVHTVCCRDRTLRVSDPSMPVTNLYQGYTVERPAK